MKMKTLSISVIIFFLFVNQFVFTQTDDEFRQAVSFFESGKYEDALILFDSVIQNGKSSNQSYAEVLKGKTLLKMEHHRLAEQFIQNFISQNKKSEYIVEAKIDLAEAQLKLEKYDQCLKTLLEILNLTTASNDIQLIKANCENLIFDNFDLSSLQSIISGYSDDKVFPFLTLVYGKLLLKNGNNVEAKKQFFTIIQNYPDSDEYQPALDYLEQRASTPESQPHSSSDMLVAVLLPLNLSAGSNSHVSMEVLEGIKYAADEFNTLSNSRIGLVIRDTRTKKEEIEKIFAEIGNNSAVKAVIGPLYSEETDFTCDIFSGLDIPIISPTATDDHLTKKYNNVFQANPSFEMRGKIMAQYIYFVENKKNIAILYSEEGYSNNLAQAFLTEFEKLGGNIVTTQQYSVNSTKLSEPIKNIKKLISGIDGLYIPISDSKIASLLLSNLFLNGIDVNLYGNQDWFTATGFESSSSLSNKLTFTSDYFFDYKNSEFLEFGKSYFDKTGFETSRNVFYGYDAAKLLFNYLSSSSNAASFRELMMNSNNTFEGFHNNINFGEERINRWLNIVRFKNGVFELVDKFLYEY